MQKTEPEEPMCGNHVGTPLSVCGCPPPEGYVVSRKAPKKKKLTHRRVIDDGGLLYTYDVIARSNAQADVVARIRHNRKHGFVPERYVNIVRREEL